MVIWTPYLWNRMNKRENSPPSLGTISSWVVIFILPINSALNPILYTLTTSFFREQVEVLLCHWQRRHMLKKDRKSLTSSTIFVDTPRMSCYHLPSSLQRVSLKDADPRYAWSLQEPFGTVQTGGWRQRTVTELFHHGKVALWHFLVDCSHGMVARNHLT